MAYKKGLKVALPIQYEEHSIESGYRIDMLVVKAVLTDD